MTLKISEESITIEVRANIWSRAIHFQGKLRDEVVYLWNIGKICKLGELRPGTPDYNKKNLRPSFAFQVNAETFSPKI